MSKKDLKNNEDSKKIEDLKLKEISKHQNSGVISFTKEEEDKKSLAVNPIRYLLPLDCDKAPLKEENIEINLKEKEKPDDKGFEIIMEINPNIYEDKKKKNKRKSNLPMLYNQEEIKEETLGILDDYREIFSRQMKLALNFSEIYINSMLDMQKSFFEDYFDFLDSLSKK